jgi:drug/metabolite transporter (DMT)-like permease
MEREVLNMLQTSMVLIVNTLIYAGIGMLVGVAIAYCQAMEDQLLYLLWRGALTGIVIGTVAKFSVVLLHRNRKSSTWSLYGLMLLVAGGLTLATSFSLNLATQLTVLSIVEPLALLTMYLNIRYSERLNEGLKRKQSILAQKAGVRLP